MNNVQIRYAQIKDASGNRQRIYFIACPSPEQGRMRSLTPTEYQHMMELAVKGWKKSWWRRFCGLFHRKAVSK